MAPTDINQNHIICTQLYSTQLMFYCKRTYVRSPSTQNRNTDHGGGSQLDVLHACCPTTLQLTFRQQRPKLGFHCKYKNNKKKKTFYYNFFLQFKHNFDFSK